MAALRLPQLERRRDRRFALAGSVRLVVGEPLSTVEGGILDVCAGGVRCQVADGTAPLVGGEVDVEVTIRDLSDPTRPPTIRLRGKGQVVRRVPPAGTLPCEVAVHLDGPLGFRDYFTQMRLF